MKITKLINGTQWILRHGKWEIYLKSINHDFNFIKYRITIMIGGIKHSAEYTERAKYAASKDIEKYILLRLADKFDIEYVKEIKNVINELE